MEEKDDRDYGSEELPERIEAAWQRMQQGLPPVPWLPRVCSLVSLSRDVRRLRAGELRSVSPRMSTRAVADTLEQGIVLNRLEMQEQMKEDDERAKQFAEEQQEILEYNRLWLECYWIFKKLPDAQDPTSEVAAQVLSMKKELRKLRGRARKGKGKKGRVGG
jgi:hypothetical protein